MTTPLLPKPGGVRERPIIFSGPMVRAILAGTKSQTRRIVTPQPVPWEANECFLQWKGLAPLTTGHIAAKHGRPGDRLWVREAFQPIYAPEFQPFGRNGGREANWRTGEGYAPRYMATDERVEWVDREDNLQSDRAEPAVHMPRWASRITLEITDVRVQRLQEITEEDAKAEGVEEWCSCVCHDETNVQTCSDCGDRHGRDGFVGLWDAINGKRAPWDSNPWVWALTFRRVSS